MKYFDLLLILPHEHGIFNHFTLHNALMQSKTLHGSRKSPFKLLYAVKVYLYRRVLDTHSPISWDQQIDSTNWSWSTRQRSWDTIEKCFRICKSKTCIIDIYIYMNIIYKYACTNGSWLPHLANVNPCDILLNWRN